MKKMSFWAVVCAIAIAATVSSCNSKKEPAIPEGTAVGNIAYFTPEGSATVSFIKTNAAGEKEVHPTEYSEIKAEDGFIVAKETSGKLNLLTPDGQSFSICESYELTTYFPVASGEEPAKVILTIVPGNQNHLAYDGKTFAPKAMAVGIKSAAIPLSNGITLYQKKDGWGFGPSEAEDGTLEDLKAVAAVSCKGKFYIWISSSKFTGLVTPDGKPVKAMNQKAVKKGKILWEKDGSFGVELKSI